MGLSQLLDEIYFRNFWETLLGCFHTNSKYFWISCMSVILLVGYFLTEIRQIWVISIFGWYLSEILLRHFLDIGSLVFTLLGWAYILTSEFLCAGLNFETFDCVTFWFPGSASETSGLVNIDISSSFSIYDCVRYWIVVVVRLNVHTRHKPHIFKVILTYVDFI